MKIAVEGCMHGELDKVYATLKRLEEVENTKIDLLLCCGDFQAVRNENDLQCLNVKPKYREMGTFWKYYLGQVKAPYPTIFIGGNHEASNHLWELYYGGWAATNIFFLGFSGVVKFGNIRIGGLSGIYKPQHYLAGYFEKLPYSENDIRSVYHVRYYDVLKLLHVEEPIDIFLSHDWPLGITDYGNWQRLIKAKPFFKEEVERKTLGSKPAALLLDKLRPPYWFSAHLHCKFPAMIQHGEGGPVTKFLALDKCLPNRGFLQVIEIQSDPGPYEITYDEEWLAIIRKFNGLFPLTRNGLPPWVDRLDIREDREWVKNRLDERGRKPFDFVQSTRPFDPSRPISNPSITMHCRNPQTESLMLFLEQPYLLDSTNRASTEAQSNTYPSRDANDDADDDDDNVDDDIEVVGNPDDE
ncbi:putative Lariat debranching enzyme [Carex littledalei]|uniref:Putative Lariat debranching enzyme n=1 Tax=Carex littledalei TaxID=544730 RepID=A0A833UYR5_9POAL|nr:putative Lariat debranching enzyme [Carex littledalei]